jgi:hypothetical protein
VSHPLSAADLSSLARGIVTSEIVHRLNAAQLAKHQLLLEAVRRKAAAAVPTPPSQTLINAIEELAELQSQQPSVVNELLALPQVGSWAIACLARLRGGERPDADYLADLAAVAALRTGRKSGLPADDADETPFPGRGVVRGTRWTPVPRLCVRVDDLSLSVRLDATDPYLAMYGRRTRPDLQAWRDRLTDAWRILVRRHGTTARALAAGVTTLVPLAEPPSGPPLSAASGWAYGAVAASLPADSPALAEILVHEFQHLTLGAVEDLVALTHAGDERLWYAPWRDDPRPLSALLQGCYAFLAITEFWRAERDAGPPEHRRRAEAAFARWRRATFEAAQTLTGADGLTATGRAFAVGIRDRLEPWMEEGVSADAERDAVRICEEHRARWDRANNDAGTGVSRASARR